MQLFGYEITARPLATPEIIREVVANELNLRLFNSCKGLDEFKKFYQLFHIVRLLENDNTVKLVEEDKELQLELNKFYDIIQSVHHLDKIHDNVTFGVGCEGKVTAHIKYCELYNMRTLEFTKEC